MKSPKPFFISLLMACSVAICFATTQSSLQTITPSMEVARQKTALRDWRFFRGDQPQAAQVDFNDAEWEQVRIPHDWAIYGPFDHTIDMQTVAIKQNGEKVASTKTGRTGALPYVGVGWYRTEIAADDYRGKRAVLIFDGAMSQARVYLNGEEIGYWPYGYNSFYIDISRSLKNDEKNILAVRLENLNQSSRWYPGAGLYRNVYLQLTAETSIDVWGSFITTPYVSDQEAKINVKTHIHAPVKGLRIKTDIQNKDGKSLTASEDTLLIDQTFEQILSLKQPQCWSPESPMLYRAVSTLYIGAQAIDCDTIVFGVRTIAFDSQRGFQLNGQSRKIKGVCLHHDLGPIGTAINRSALERQLRILKDMGCDAIRTSHNMPSPEQISLCDELGLMVMAESFDEWAGAKCKNGYNLFYEEWVDKDIKNLVRRYRNHPSIIMWSAGNEVPDQWNEKGIKEGMRLQHLFHREDPTRPVTMGMDQVSNTIKNGFAAYWDVPGLNYRLPLYEEAHKRLPQGFLLGSETASTVSSRGVYHFPVREYKGKTYDDGQCSSYDLEACGWSNIPDDDWVWQDDHDWVIGEFVWTGFDYLGEPTPYDGYGSSRSSYFGICDLAGLPKDRYYLYRSRWNTREHTLHILPHWTWPNKIGDTIPVFVYTDYPSAELFINGKSQGKRSKMLQGDRIDRYRLRWMDCVYEPGTLKVVAYDADGKAVAEEECRTAGKAHHLQLSANKIEMPAEADELTYVTVRVEDKDGNLCPDADCSLSIQVSGQGSFRAACNGDATSTEIFHQPQMKAFHGMMVVLVQSNGKEGKIRLTVSGKGLKSGTLDIVARK